MIGAGQLANVQGYARDGGRVKVLLPGAEKEKQVWKGLGNPSGLGGYADTLNREAWDKGGARFTKKIEALPAGVEIRMYEYRSINRDRGRWVLDRVYMV